MGKQTKNLLLLIAALNRVFFCCCCMSDPLTVLEFFSSAVIRQVCLLWAHLCGGVRCFFISMSIEHQQYKMRTKNRYRTIYSNPTPTHTSSYPCRGPTPQPYLSLSEGKKRLAKKLKKKKHRENTLKRTKENQTFWECKFRWNISRTQISDCSGVITSEFIMNNKGFQILSNFLREPLRENLSLSNFKLCRTSHRL